MEQAELMQKFNDEYRQKFNPELFERSDDEIIDELKNIILSCQRDKLFTIRVESFRVVEDYKEINDMLYKYEEAHINKNKADEKKKTKKKDNEYNFINLKDSDIKLLVVRYFIKVKDEQETVEVLIAIPRIVDRYYFRISGNVYSAMYQIVDASTYNNTNSSSSNTNNKHSVTLKTMFMPVRVYRYKTTKDSLKTTNKETIECTYYMSNVFNKTLPTIKYLLAKFGIYKTLNFMHMSGAIWISDEDPKDDNLYTFNKGKVYINTPKYIFNNDSVVQSFVYTVHKAIFKDTTTDDLCDPMFWIESLGNHFNNGGIEKGYSIIDSLEHVYDLSTKASIHLPEEDKADIYHILKWMIGEFNNLKIKDNLDISTKKIRCSEYIASLYAMKLSTGIYRISDLGKKIKLSSIKKVIMTFPTYLTRAITRCQLVSYRNLVNDTDSLTAIKYTVKGLAGIGEKSSNAVPSTYRSVHQSHIGRLDINASSPGDPGVSGTLCPFLKLEEGSFSEFTEPNTWDIEFSKLMSNYKALIGQKEIIAFKDKLGIPSDKEEAEGVDEAILNIKQFTKPICKVEKGKLSNKIHLERNGVIYYE